MMEDQLAINLETGEVSVIPRTPEEEAAILDSETEVAELIEGYSSEVETRSTIEEEFVAALASNEEFLENATPSNVQVINQVKSLTRQISGIGMIVANRLDLGGEE
jgi:uncharacterized UPF0160 family protein